ncbi:hypothetical protein D5R81_17855 [Parashewanella spongiae]|uniref:Uncharacterized protein n=1 Tax=Parashewanella spongiae TaxID=342950 RepID=A0A3A6TMZ7_9GAMM|nr:hypothetical protein [Parashewanella spongiae]MCL1080181.1 hypothetical protein [Parashewanella spongiae]RJY06355.1 hypothetical protein D5R81_17855 [Parashewanella spongiae]
MTATTSAMGGLHSYPLTKEIDVNELLKETEPLAHQWENYAVMMEYPNVENLKIDHGDSCVHCYEVLLKWWADPESKKNKRYEGIEGFVSLLRDRNKNLTADKVQAAKEKFFKVSSQSLTVPDSPIQDDLKVLRQTLDDIESELKTVKKKLEEAKSRLLRCDKRFEQLQESFKARDETIIQLTTENDELKAQQAILREKSSPLNSSSESFTIKKQELTLAVASKNK